MGNSFNQSYVGSRPDVASLVDTGFKKILDIGCSIGTLGEFLKKRQDAEITGVECNKEMAGVARTKLDRVIEADIENLIFKDNFKFNYFDCIIFSDVLEHLRDPWFVLKEFSPFLKNDGCIIASIPNVRHYSTLHNLLIKGYWPYRERGIHDKNHLRFFTLKNIKEMFRDIGFNIVRIERTYRIIESPHPVNKFSKYFVFLQEFVVFQYLIVAKKKTSIN